MAMTVSYPKMFEERHYSNWHRPPTLPDYCSMIDLDGVDFCKQCSTPLLLVEAARYSEREKPTTVLKRLARMANPKHPGAKVPPAKAVVSDDRRTTEVLPPPSLKDLGISKDQSAQAQKLAAMPDSDFEGFLASATTDGLTVKHAVGDRG